MTVSYQTLPYNDVFLSFHMEMISASQAWHQFPQSLFQIVINNQTVLKDAAIVSSHPMIFASLLYYLTEGWVR